MKKNKTIPEQIDNFLDDIQSVLMSFLVKLGPFAVALMPALFTAYAIFHTFRLEAGEAMAFIFAITVGLAFETVGIVATHTALDLYNAADDGKVKWFKFWLMAFLVPVYVIGTAVVVLFSKDAFTDLVKGLGVASPFLTAIVYIAVALARDIRKAETRQSETDEQRAEIERKEREWQHEKEQLELAQKHAERLAKIEAKQTKSYPQNGPQNGNNMPPLRIPKREWRDTASEILRDEPGISGAELARRIGAGERTGQNILKELRSQSNGNGSH